MTYRPLTPDGRPPTIIGPEQMARHQEAERERIDRAVAERNKHAADLEAERERQRWEQATARLDAYRAQVLSRWLDN